jgi:transcriptional regulator with XRE-family HTH domain
MLVLMEELRFGRMLRLVRRRARMTQMELAEKAGVSQQTVSSIELGHADDSTLRTIKRISAPLGITIDLVPRWRGPELERLADARHVRIVEFVVSRLGGDWQMVVEYTFNHFGDRGSVDILAWQPSTRALLLVEVKSELDSAEALLRSMDSKVRVVPGLIAAQKGWRHLCLGSVLVLPDETAPRRAVAHLASVFDAALPGRTVAVRQWIGKPVGQLRGIWFLADTPTRGVIRNPGSPGLIRRPHPPEAHA